MVIVFFNKQMKTVNHLLIKCEFSYNIWSSISYYCPYPVALNENLIDWLEYMWKFRNYYTKFFLTLWKRLLLYMEYLEP